MLAYFLLLLPLSTQVAGALDKTFGVAPDLVSKYVPMNGKWKCLDGSKEIPWELVNDDSCDCADGSDEPGTGACPDTFFYCHNKGHIGASIPSSRVRDGICEPQCCDGSDERPGVCKNVCEEVGEAHQKKNAAEMKLRKTLLQGSKIRSTYIAFAHKEKKRLEERTAALEKEIQAKEIEVQQLKNTAERTESFDAAVLEHKKQSPLYLNVIDHHNALEYLQSEVERYRKAEKKLGEILDTLRRGYNPNYQDMAVLEAVRGWEKHADLPHINDVGKEGEAAEEEKKEKPPAATTIDGEVWTEEMLQKELKALIKTDFDSLLVEDDEYHRSNEVPEENRKSSVLFDVTSYLPDFAVGYYDQLKDGLVSLFGSAPEASTKAKATKAREAFNKADEELRQLQTDKQQSEREAAKIFDVKHFGAEGAWKKLDNTCIEYDDGDYIYETCFFKESKQKPKGSGITQSLGNFESWNPSPDVEPGTPEYYSKQVYKHGSRCWNGPERNVIFILTCGTENTITSVQELEKCEYQFTGTTPALCLPVTESNTNNKSRQEL
ncbi:hypothetical protein AGABI1DRAFT_35773 [Agaricus bisporus var. burnettii JB137-S8]|uniref:Glucosidase 2 subunit beta n=1 Tax=Agaricus bisporus var. burnettii (strain JB137-S8 / ATCC MYA-4627 / FGSC 10392) TaxID=597362 RepID=K5XFW1_AGABU|nr:uncharacterized protein AGABI1DRAFT_35773 [Agaricus bisporus var. burnettii JB137-S8]EKM82097.1 hypothetical protein AGABI1DRAFT_35773 [Agaricus bisporus var. burnettii JB137-S8]